MPQRTPCHRRRFTEVVEINRNAPYGVLPLASRAGLGPASLARSARCWQRDRLGMPKLGIHGIEPLVQPGHVFLRVLESAAHLFCECRLIGQGLRTITPARMPDRVAFPPPMRTQAMAPLGPALLQTSCETRAQAGGTLRCLFPVPCRASVHLRGHAIVPFRV